MQQTPAARQSGKVGCTLGLVGVVCVALALIPPHPAWAAPPAPLAGAPADGWETFGRNPQHTGLSTVAARPLEIIRWFTPVDEAPPTGEILIHYGSPLVTPANTVIVPVKTGSTNGFKVDARSAADGSLIWSASTDYILPPHNWTPSYSPALATANRLYFAGAGGTVYFRDNADAAAGASGQLAFFGMANYSANPASFNATVFIDTPITVDSAGNIYFGFRTSGSAPLGLTSGLARIDASGTGTWTSAVTASGGDANITRVPHQAAPALSHDEQTLYAVVASANTATSSYLVGLNPTTLALKESAPGVSMRIALKDPRNGAANNAGVLDDSSASPMVGPDGDVYYGVMGTPFNGSRGWMLHFSGDLTQTKTPGAFGWDNTAAIVPAAMVPSYSGTSTYLIFTKYNNYAGLDGGDGVNKIAVLDPNATMAEPHASSNGLLVMKVVLTIAGPTPDPEHTAQFPNAVREWCINSAAVDPFTSSVMANSEDGTLYRWDLTTNTLSQMVTLSAGIGEAYTPTVIGPDGTVYAINESVVNAVGSQATPTVTVTETPAPTATPTSTPTVSAANAVVLGSVSLQGRPPPPDARWSVPLQVSLTPPGPGAVASCTPTTDQSGTFTCASLVPGTYVGCVKHSHTLQNCQNVILVSGDNPVNFGTLREGDANDDNCVQLVDFSILATSFSTCSGDAGFDARADFDLSGCVVLVDFSLLSANFGQCGDQP